jgi:hypothetical protein
MKKIVRCIVHPKLPIVVGKSALINTIDHPDLSNGPTGETLARTSTVVTIFEDGSFETLNTLYRPVEQLNG